MEIGKDYFKSPPTTIDVLSQALDDIKGVIHQAPSTEIVGESTLTLMKIYSIIEEAEKMVKK
jgi:hypothetical protein|tara:strand:+ start:290 stop:475 length:186 start_codon:yes stop_codon:yes gene_type:complete